MRLLTSVTARVYESLVLIDLQYYGSSQAIEIGIPLGSLQTETSFAKRKWGVDNGRDFIQHLLPD